MTGEALKAAVGGEIENVGTAIVEKPDLST